MKQILALTLGIWTALAFASDSFSTTLSGSLSFQDQQVRGCPADWLPIPVTVGQQLQIDLESSSFDTYLYLSRYSSVEAAYLLDEDDDGGLGLDSRLTHRVERDGMLYIGASSLDCSTGSYTVRVESQVESQADRSARSDSIVGVLREGESDITLGGNYINWHRVYFSAGEQLSIWNYSDDFDTMLYLVPETPDGRRGAVLARGDDCDDTRHACIRYSVEQTGYYQLGASSYYSDATGFYRLEISKQQAAQNDPILFRGELSHADATYPDGSAVDWYPITIPSSGARIIIDLESDDFDAYLVLANYPIRTDNDERYFIEANDDGGYGSNARLDIMLGAGTYYIGANSFFDELGNYDLEIEIRPDEFDLLQTSL